MRFLQGNVTEERISASYDWRNHLWRSYALYVSLKAKPGKENDVEAFLKQGAEMAKKEPGTVNWYGVERGDGTTTVSSIRSTMRRGAMRI